MRKVSEVTTEQIREATSKGFVASLGYKSISDTQFDLWLVTERNRVAELAIAKERERIINKLMLSSIELRYWDGIKVRDISHDTHTAKEAEEELIALIKGENK
jgi:hypothetical protein